jgi:RNA polymerase sigma-70 factor (ECF subfamily)
MSTHDDPATEELLSRAASGDGEAAAQVVQLHDVTLRRVIRLRLDHRVAQRVDVEDVLQETHMEALKRLPGFLAKRDVALLVWVRFLAVQRCVTLARVHLLAGMRDARRERPLDAAEGDATSMALAYALSAHMTTPSLAVARDEIQDGVRSAVHALAPLDREILCLRHFEGLDNAMAAEVLSLSAAAASKRYIRALTRLRDVLAAQGLDTMFPKQS